MLTKDELPECPVATTVQLIGSKWKLLIIRNLLERPWRFNELKKKFRRNQPEGFNGQLTCHGRGWNYHKNCLPGSSASCGICTQ